MFAKPTHATTIKEIGDEKRAALQQIDTIFPEKKEIKQYEMEPAPRVKNSRP